MLKLVLIGTGNVASHLFNAFLNSKEVSIEQVFGRNREKLKKFSKYVPVTSLSSEVKEADIYVIATAGGKATRLTSHSAYDTKPVWSHDHAIT